MSMPFVSIVILNYNHPEVINICLTTLATTQGYLKYEVVVVDNGSTEPGTLEALHDSTKSHCTTYIDIAVAS